MASVDDFLTGDEVYDRAFLVLSNCPAWPDVAEVLRFYAHGLAERIRAHADGELEDYVALGLGQAADLIDPEVPA